MQELKCNQPDLTSSAKNLLLSYDWPGNVRQLKKAVIYAVNVAEGKTISENHLPEEILYSKPAKKITGEEEEILTLQEIEELQIRKALKNTRNNINLAAKLLNIGKSTLYHKIKLYNIDID